MKSSMEIFEEKEERNRRRNIILTVLAICIVIAGTLYATTFKYVYPAETVLVETDFYEGAVADLASDTNYDYTGNIDLETNGYYGLWITLEYNSSGTTDNIIISYFTSYDGTNFDDVEFWTCEVDATSGADEQITFLMWPAPPNGRIGVKGSGSTDSFDYQITYLPAYGDGT